MIDNIKYCVPAVTVLLFVMIQFIAAQPGSFGVGVIVGEPVGLSAKVWLTDVTAVSGAAGWSIGGDRMEGYYYNVREQDRFHLHLDLLWHSFDLIKMLERYPVYAGIGARMNSGAGRAESFAFRGVVGIAWLPRALPVDVFMEFVPMVQMSQSVGVGFDAGVGMRYFFQ